MMIDSTINNGDRLRPRAMRHLGGADYAVGDFLKCDACGKRVMRIVRTKQGNFEMN